MVLEIDSVGVSAVIRYCGWKGDRASVSDASRSRTLKIYATTSEIVSKVDGYGLRDY